MDIEVSPYARWQQTGSGSDLNAVVEAHIPTMDRYIATYGLNKSALISNEAKLLTAKAVQSYSPDSGASLPTWISKNLQPLHRYKRQKLSPITIPERLKYDAVLLNMREKELVDKYQRDPTALELAEASNMSTRRLKAAREDGRSIGAESRAVDAFGDEQSLRSPITDSDSSLEEAVHMVLPELGRLDQQILEMKSGLWNENHKTMSHSEIATKLNIPGANLTRRAARIAKRVNEIRDALSGGNSL